MTAETVLTELHLLANPEKAAFLSRYFKTGPGQYGEGDIFIGITVPVLRNLSKSFYELSLDETQKLLHSEIHEARTVALFILVRKYAKGSLEDRAAVYGCYLANTRYINNWDLVDTSAEFIVGPHVEGTDKSVLQKLAVSDSLWERRIAMLSCFHYIKKRNPAPALEIVEILQNDRHDLIHKAVGWMLREIGGRCSREDLVKWLGENGRYKTLPRTTLRYAIEHFSPEERKAYLQGRI